ncbi:MAG: 2,3-bisphosphoglycerate-independent phosphoglycerate mutase [bacterium]|nr:2,3-bisphosphoglycerate-independent phosphoglycerate mutase [bacterium]
MKKRAILIILDGFGLRDEKQSNAIAHANAPTLKKLMTGNYPKTRLKTSGKDVGLPTGQMGNSEVGHLNIGAGRIVYQDITRINEALSNGAIKKNKVFKKLISEAKQKSRNNFHLLGLVSDGGVHSSLDHLKGLLNIFRKEKIQNVAVHAFTDGRDTPPYSGIEYVNDIHQYARNLGYRGVVSVMGRYYAMDRDKRWNRIKSAYDCLVFGKGQTFLDPVEAIKESYEKNVTDEFIVPSLIVNDLDNYGRIKQNDIVLFFNFRADRARQLTKALTKFQFNEFDVEDLRLSYYTMTQYDATFPFPFLFEPIELKQIFGEVISERGLKQLRCAETEKYAHVTYFFNGGVEVPFPNEERILIPSPNVSTYDQKPEMSSVEVTDAVVNSISKNEFDLVVVNFANCDMVGHTGVFAAAVAAVEAVDKGVKRILETALTNHYGVFVTADHGNAEQMWDDKANCPHTQHTLNDVFFVAVIPEKRKKLKTVGRLADIAPTILEWMDIPIPNEMTGKSLFLK